MNAETKSTAAKRRRIPVILYFDGVEEWRGSFGDFCEVNADGMSLGEIRAAGDALMAGREYQHGGGAAPLFTIKRDPGAEWLRAFCRCTITDADRRAFAAIEKPAVSPTLDR